MNEGTDPNAVYNPTKYDTFLVKEYNDGKILLVKGARELAYQAAYLSNEDQRILDERFVKNGPAMYVRLEHFSEDNYYQGGKLIYNEKVVTTFTKLSEVVSKPLSYIKYVVSDTTLHVQRDGMLVLCGTSGSGKTHTALYSLKTLLQSFDEVLYLNWEITENDLKQRVRNNRIPSFDEDRVVLSSTQNVNEIIKYMGDKNIAVIIDNIDNLIGAGDNQFQEQLAFIKAIDNQAKLHNQHVLMLTQHIKDSKMTLFDKTGKWMNTVNLSLLSGVKQLGDMSRSVIITSYFDGEANPGYKAKVIKKGSGRFDWEPIQDF